MTRKFSWSNFQKLWTLFKIPNPAENKTTNFPTDAVGNSKAFISDFLSLSLSDSGTDLDFGTGESHNEFSILEFHFEWLDYESSNRDAESLILVASESYFAFYLLFFA